jgi:hypothetical protein
MNSRWPRLAPPTQQARAFFANAAARRSLGARAAGPAVGRPPRPPPGPARPPAGARSRRVQLERLTQLTESALLVAQKPEQEVREEQPERGVPGLEVERGLAHGRVLPHPAGGFPPRRSARVLGMARGNSRRPPAPCLGGALIWDRCEAAGELRFAYDRGRSRALFCCAAGPPRRGRGPRDLRARERRPVRAERPAPPAGDAAQSANLNLGQDASAVAGPCPSGATAIE